MNFTDDIPKYKKKSQAMSPKKAKHKHLYEPCIIEIPSEWYKKEHERSCEMTPHFNAYCPICGKVASHNPYNDRWWTKEECYNGAVHYYKTVSSAEGARELNPETRTIPTFRTDDAFPKFVNLEAST